MTRPAVEVADILRAQGNSFLDRHRGQLRFQQLKVMRAILRCRTAALGGHIDRCLRCGKDWGLSFNSCRDRHCPKCQAQSRQRWIAASTARTVGDPLLSRRIYAAPPTQRTDPAKPRRTLQPVVPLRGGDAYGGGRQSQTSWRRDRILRDPPHVEPESLVSSSPPLSRSIWRLGARSHTLDTWLCHILLTP